MPKLDPTKVGVGAFARVRSDNGAEAIYEITREPWQLGHGAWVIGLRGISGGYSFDRVQEIGVLCAICRRIHQQADRTCCLKCIPPDEGEIIARSRLDEVKSQWTKETAALNAVIETQQRRIECLERFKEILRTLLDKKATLAEFHEAVNAVTCS